MMIRVPSAGRSSANLRKERRISSISLKKSRWSASMFRMMLIFGKKLKKLLVYSQASVRKVSDCPTRMFPPIAGRMPPTLMVGSQSPFRRMWDSMEVVVVLPWVPATAMGVS